MFFYEQHEKPSKKRCKAANVWRRADISDFAQDIFGKLMTTELHTRKSPK